MEDLNTLSAASAEAPTGESSTHDDRIQLTATGKSSTAPVLFTDDGAPHHQHNRSSKRPKKLDEADEELANFLDTFGSSYWTRGDSDDNRLDRKDDVKRHQTTEEEGSENRDSTLKLHEAAACGNVDTVSLLIRQGIDIGAVDHEKATAMHYAAENDETNMIKLLLNVGGDIDASDLTGKTPLYWAAKRGRVRLTTTGWTPLHAAARDGNELVLEVLIIYGFDVDARSHFGVTPLYLAVLKQHERSVMMLLEAGANPKLKNRDGISPMSNAIQSQNQVMITVLLKSTVPGLSERAYEEVVHYLLVEDHEFQIAMLFSAIETSNEEFLMLCLSLGANLDEVNEDGLTLLHLAVHQGNLAITQLLLSNGADIEAKTAVDKSTAILLATASIRVDIVELLLDCNANIEAKTDLTGRTALHIAADLANTAIDRVQAQEAKDLVWFLLRRGAHSGALDKFGNTPLQLAQCVRDQSRAATDVLLNRPAVERRSWVEESMPAAAKLSTDEEKVCKLFNAFLVDFNSPFQSTGKEPARGYKPPVQSPHKHSKRTKRHHVQSSKEFEELQGESVSGRAGRPDLSKRFVDRVNWLPRIKTVFEVNHTSGPKRIMEEAHKSVAIGSEHLFRWIHTPANNIVWVKITKPEPPRTDEAETTTNNLEDLRLAIYMPFLSFDTGASRQQLAAVMKNFDAKPNLAVKAAASIQQQSKPDTDLFDKTRTSGNVGNHQYTTRRQRIHGSSFQRRFDQRPLDFGDPPQNLMEPVPVSRRDKHKLLIQQYLGHDRGSIHLSRTLDQFYYDSIDTQGRDIDQVVYRFSKLYSSSSQLVDPDSVDEGSTNHDFDVPSNDTRPKRTFSGQMPTSSVYSGNPRIFTVDQLWIWIIDEETIISCFPERWGEDMDQEPKVLESLQHHLRDNDRPQFTTVFEMAAVITSYCMRFADKCRVKGESKGVVFEESFLEIYGSAISRLADTETELFRKFQEQVAAAKEKRRKKPKNTSTKLDLKGTKTKDDTESDEKTDITGEIEVLKEIKDIRDEVNILQTLLGEQNSVANILFERNNGLNLDRKTQDYYYKQSGLENRIRVVEKMDRDAETIFKHVNILLDLKQKQASIDEALAAAKQGTIAAEHAETAANQGAVVMIFTLVTIIFLPMTFLTSLYALNINSFPHNPAGDLAYEPRYIFPRLFGISFSIAIILVSLAFQVRRIRDIFKKNMKILKRLFLKHVTTWWKNLLESRPKSNSADEEKAKTKEDFS